MRTFVCAQGQTKNIIYVRYTGIFFSFLAQLLSVLLQSIFHILSENYVIFSEYLNICTGVNKSDQATICSKSPPTSTSVQLPFLSLWTQRNVELIPDEGSGLGEIKKKRVLENNSAASWRFEGFLSTAHAALKSSPHLLNSVTFSRSDYFRLLLVVSSHDDTPSLLFLWYTFCWSPSLVLLSVHLTSLEK